MCETFEGEDETGNKGGGGQIAEKSSSVQSRSNGPLPALTRLDARPFQCAHARQNTTLLIRSSDRNRNDGTTIHESPSEMYASSARRSLSINRATQLIHLSPVPPRATSFHQHIIMYESYRGYDARAPILRSVKAAEGARFESIAALQPQNRPPTDIRILVLYLGTEFETENFFERPCNFVARS